MDKDDENPIAFQLEIFADRVRQVARGQRTACACDGPPGVGKTHTLVQVCKEEGKLLRLVNTTAGGLVQMAYRYHQIPVVAFDDCDVGLRSEQTANVIKQLTAPEKVRRVNHQTVTAINNQARNSPKDHIAPPTFVVRSGYVMLTNVDMRRSSTAISKDMREHVRALHDRGLEFVHISRDPQHIANYVTHLARTTDMLKQAGIELSKTAFNQVEKFFLANLNRFETISLRRFMSIARDRQSMPDRWKVLQTAAFVEEPLIERNHHG